MTRIGRKDGRITLSLFNDVLNRGFNNSYQEKMFHRITSMTENIPLIEKVMGFKLYEHQIKYLLVGTSLPTDRRTGKTTIYIIKLALSDGPPLNLRKPSEFSDGWELGANNHRRYAKVYFLHEFMRIREKFRNAGFKVRDVKR